MGINKDQVKGRVEEVAGKAKEVVGHVIGNDDLEVRGAIEKNIGAARARVGDVKEDVRNIGKK